MTRDDNEGWRRGRWLLFFAVVAAVELRIAFDRVMAGDGYSAGDWLINYSAGFVRRGLAGEVILWLAGLLHVGFLPVVFGVQAVCLLVYLGLSCRMVVRFGRGFTVAAMVLSPAAVVFEMWNPAEGQRKELLLFAVMALLVGVKIVERMRGWVLSLALAVVCAGLVLSHESLVVYLPYVFAALWIRRGREAWGIAIAPGVASAVAAVAVMRHPGDAGMAAVICQSVSGTFTGFGTGLCGGSIAWLQVTLAWAHRATVEVARSNDMGRIYSLLAVLALLPVCVVGWRLRDRVEVRVIGVCALLSGAGSAVLFYSGVDWGRWIHIHVVCLMLLLLAILPRAIVAGTRPRGGSQLARPVVVGLYATCWILPVTIMSSGWLKLGVTGAIVQAFLK